MATLSRRNGRGYIQFKDDAGKRRTVQLGKGAERAHRLIRQHVDELLNAKATGSTAPRETAWWLASIGESLHGQLVSLGLAHPRETQPAVRLGEFLYDYLTRRTDIKERTVANFQQVKIRLEQHFGERRDLTSITPGEAADWHRKLKADHYAKATVAMHVKKAKQFFQDAIDRRLITANPFAKLVAGTQANAERQEYVKPETIQKVIDACPDAEWRLMFAVARFAGLRVPSETRLMTWGDVHFGRGRMLVHSPKTEHHEGRATRLIPIYPKVAEYLTELWSSLDARPGPKDFVFARLRNRALVTQAEKIIDKAGLQRWGKLWQNLRSSCQTDLGDVHPDHVVCRWMGNSQSTARKHYLQVTDEHFERAAPGAALSALQDLSDTEKPNEKPRGMPGAVAPKYPQGESNRPPKYPRNPKILKTALRHALRRGEGAR